MSALELFLFLLFTFGHFISVPLWLNQFGGSKFFCVEEYLFYAAFFSVGSFYVVLHLIWLLGGISLWKGLIAFSILHFCLWQSFVKVSSSRDDKPHKFDSIDIIVFILVAAVIGQWINLAYQHDRISGFDALHYHLPHIANFAAGEPLLGLLSTGHLYPMSHALLGGWLFMGFGSPLVVDWMNIPAFVLIFSSFSLLLRILTNRSGFIWALLVVVILFSSDMLEDATKVSADLSHASSYLALFTILTSIAAKQQLDRLEWFALTICLGLVIGSKSPGLSLIFITIAVFLCLKVVGLFEFEIIRPDIKYSLLYVLLFIFSGGIWLFRNWYLFGSPIAPVGVSIFGFELFNGISFDRLRYYLSVLKDMRDIPDYNFLHHLYLSTQRWYGDHYLLIYSFSGMLFLDSFLSRHFRGKTIISRIAHLCG